MLSQPIEFKQINKQFTKFVIPSVIGMVVQSLYIILDGIVVGQGLGEAALGAINIAFPFGMLTVALSMLIGIGGSNIYSIYKGQGEPEKANNLFCQSLALLAAIGAVLAFGGFFFRRDIAVFLGANEELLPSVTAYLKWLTPFMLLQMIVMGGATFIRNDDAPKLIMIASVTGSIVNAILDVIFILILGYGIEVSAITNGVGMLIELAFYTTHFIRGQGMLRLRKPAFYGSEIKRIFSNGFATFLMEFSKPTITFFFNRALMGTVGAISVSAFSIVIYASSILNMMLIGVTQGAQPLMSFYHGKGDRKIFSHVYKKGVRTNLIIAIIAVGLFTLFGDKVAAIFVSGNPELASLTAQMLRQFAPAYIFIGVTLMNILLFQTTEQNTLATLISFLRCIGFVQVFLLLSLFVFGGKGLYLTFLAGELCHFILSQVLARKTNKQLSIKIVETEGVFHEAPANGGYIVTISREFASGGRSIGRKVAEALNVAFYDKEIVGLAAEKSRLSAETVEQSEEKAEQGFQYGLYLGTKYLPITDQVFIAESKVIEEVAGKGPCVIVGRCADHILRDNKNCIHIFIHAPLEERVRRAVEDYGLPAEDVAQTIRNNDIARESYYNHYTGAEWGDAHQYHLSINSTIGIDQCVELILHAVRTSLAKNPSSNSHLAKESSQNLNEIATI